MFGAERVFLKNLALPCTTPQGFLAPCQNSGKTNNPIPRKYPDRQKEGRMSGKTEGWTDTILLDPPSY